MEDKKDEVLAYIRANPGCLSSGVNDAVRRKASWADWIFTRRDIDALIQEGLVEERLYRGMSMFYPVNEQ
ncbi:hypothetical protein EGK75_01130 [Neisseria weixii]|uniref:Uncharacterized protein n=2 Tax=Neisseria weixii TaxID=1853276 RepID=A0A3N4N2U3_9NEIS|nr:hypothetical protein EGK74_01815 [Neisseria weixii]RPD90546.1 hypothetical protein EGK75_01130 [Neisseria weixii]